MRIYCCNRCFFIDRFLCTIFSKTINVYYVLFFIKILTDKSFAYLQSTNLEQSQTDKWWLVFTQMVYLIKNNDGTKKEDFKVLGQFNYNYKHTSADAKANKLANPFFSSVVFFRQTFFAAFPGNRKQQALRINHTHWVRTSVQFAFLLF